MVEELYELPQGWVWVTIEQLSDVVRGASPRPAGDPKYFGGNIPWITVGCLTADKKPYLTSVSEFVTEAGRAASRYIEPETLLLTNSGATLGVPKITKIGGCINDGSVALLYVDYPLKLYLYYFLSSLTKKLRTINQGAAQPNLNTGIVKSISVRLPPLDEQHRIVTKIEELFTQLDAGVELLKKVKAKLKRYRQAVLKAAVEGNLTKEWRSANQGDLEPASVLLERILKQRREKWEAEQLAKMKAQGKTPKDDSWKLKYKEAIAPDTSDLPELPDGWCWATWNQISNWITYGFTRPMPHVDEGVSIVTAKNVINGKINLADTHKTTQEAFLSLSEKDCPQIGDILITKDGTIGRASVVTLEEKFCINQSVAVIWLRSCPINRRYLLAVIESPLTQKPIWKKARGVAIQHLSITDFALIPLPLPPKDEQNKISEEIERCISVIDQLEKTIDANLKRAERLRQTILKQAFEGKLVPQDPNDEPAEKLLEHIKAEKAQREADKKPKRQSTIKSKQPRKSKTTATQLELNLDD